MGKKLVVYIISLTVCFSLISCHKKVPPTPVWNFKKNGIIIKYKADPLLNMYEGSPHTIVVEIYEMKNPDSFKNFIQFKSGIRKLLNKTHQIQDILIFKRTFIEPGSSGKILLDRVEKAKWIGIVAGYYNLEPKKSSKILKIPYKIIKKGFLKRKEIAVVPPMKIELYFGIDSIQVQKNSGELN